MDADPPLVPDAVVARSAHWVLRVGVLCLAAFVAWAATTRIDQVTRAQGDVIPGQRTQVIQTVEGGVLSRLLVQAGDIVERGDPLVELDDTRAAAALADSRAKVAALQIRIARLRAEVYEEGLQFEPELIHDYPEFVENQSELFRRRREALDDSVNALRALGDALRAEYDMITPLVEAGDASQSEVLRLTRELAQNNADLTARMNSYFQDAQAELTEAQEELTEEEQRLTDREEVLAQTRLIAPSSGVVNYVNVTTLGGVVSAGDTLLEIVPTDEAPLFEARVSTADIAFVTVGMAASVQLDAYDFSIFGGVRGTVIQVSESTLMEETPQGRQPYYRVMISLDETEFDSELASTINLRSGMTGIAQIRAMERSVLSFLLNPIIKTVSGAFRDI